MKKRFLYILWAVLFIVSGVLGFIPTPGAVGGFFLTLLGIGVFVPGGLLLWRFRQERATVRQVLWISLGSLCVTMVLMVLNILSVYMNTYWGDLLHFLLTVLGAPLMCMQYRWVSLFLWGCLLMGAVTVLRNRKKQA